VVEWSALLFRIIRVPSSNLDGQMDRPAEILRAFYQSLQANAALSATENVVKGKKSNELPISSQALAKRSRKYEGWNFNSGNYLFKTDTK